MRRDLDPPEILIIEDDQDTREVLRLALESADFRVREAEDGPQGLEMLRQHPPSLVLVDHMLPSMLGSDICQSVRREPAYSAIPLVILTAIGDAAHQVAGLRAGADDYLTKPFNIDELVARMHSHIRRSRRERQLNALTGLPGNLAIDQAIAARLLQGEQFAVAWVDIDNFKAYNDRYGFFAGDNAIEHTARLMCDVIEQAGGGQSFAGHIGGDDFVLVMPLAIAEQVSHAIVTGFDAMRSTLYAPDDLERGYTISLSRQGEQCRVPLVSISVAVVPCLPGRFEHPAQVAEVASEIKHFLKQRPGSGWLIDRRTGAASVVHRPLSDHSASVHHVAQREPAEGDGVRP